MREWRRSGREAEMIIKDGKKGKKAKNIRMNKIILTSKLRTKGREAEEGMIIVKREGEEGKQRR